LLAIEEPAPRIFTLQEARSGAEAILGYLKNHSKCPNMAKNVNDIIYYLDVQRIVQLKQKKIPFAPMNMDTT
jgi:hypothetical protein